MAETLISPGVLARENDQSQITSQPVQAGAAIVGPTVKGQPNIPKLVTSYSEYLANFGSTFTSGSDTYTFLTSISAFNYFQNGGESLLVTRVVSGSFSPAVSTEIYNGVESGKVNIINMTGSLGPANTTNADGAIGQARRSPLSHRRYRRQCHPAGCGEIAPQRQESAPRSPHLPISRLCAP